jgi:hypothetical protein
MKQKIRRHGKGRQRRFAQETLAALIENRPALRPLFTFWQRLREQDEAGSGLVAVGDWPYEGNGLFWQVGQEGELFLFSPQRVVRTLRREV